MTPERLNGAELCERIRALKPRTRAPLLVAIDGKGGAGKSTIADQIAMLVPQVTIVRRDDLCRADLQEWDWHAFQENVLRPLQHGLAGRYRPFDRERRELLDWIEVPARGIVILEGVASMRLELGDVWDLTVWVEAPKQMRIDRGTARDGEGARHLWEVVWENLDEHYMQMQTPHLRADVIIDGTAL